MLPAFDMQRTSASRAENYQLLWDTIASLKECEEAMQHAFIPVRKMPYLLSDSVFRLIHSCLFIKTKKRHSVYLKTYPLCSSCSE